MISKLSAFVTDKLYKQSIIEEDDIELFNYGLFILFSHLFFFVFSLICGIIFDLIIESAVFYVLFFFIRRYAGGIHASSEHICMISTLTSITVCLYLIKVLTFYNIKAVLFVLFFVSVVCIVAFCPLDSKSKPLTDGEKKRFRKTSLCILAGIVLVFVISLIIKKTSIQYACVLSIFLESVLLTAGKIEQFVESRRQQKS